MPIVIFLIGIAAGGSVATLKFACTLGPLLFNGDCASNKLPAATLQATRIAQAVSTARRRQRPVTVF
jgi:hypothetical protein